MATFEVIIPMEVLELAYRKGLEDGFIIANETPELESELNKNNIQDAKGI